MPTLTEADIAYVRMRSGDTCSPDYDVSDVEMQTLYDRVPNLSCGCSDALDTLIALVIDVRWTKAADLFDEDGDGGTRSVSQKFAQLERLRAHWFKKCGMDTPLITVGTFDIGMDSDCTGSENASFPYGHMYQWWGGM